MGVPDWQVAFFCLVDLGTSVLFSGSTIVSGLFSEGGKEKDHVRNTFTLQNLSSEMTYFTSTHVSLQRAYSYVHTSLQRRLESMV